MKDRKLKKDQMEYSEKILRVIDNEYERKRKDFDEIDKKIGQLIVLNTAIIAWLLIYIPMPKLWIYGKIFYLLSLGSGIVSLIFLLSLYKPKPFDSVDPDGINKKYNFKGKEGYSNFLREMPNGLNTSYRILDDLINKKDKFIARSLVLFFVSLMFAIIIKLIESW